MDGLGSDSSSSSSDDESDSENEYEIDDIDSSPPASPCRSPTPGATVSAGTDSLMESTDSSSESPATLVILDWDDTLYPTSAVSNGGYDVSQAAAPLHVFPSRPSWRGAVFLSAMSTLTARAPAYQVTNPRTLSDTLAAQIDSHSDSVIRFLRSVTSRAVKTLLITNSQEGWVDLSGNAYAPRLLEALEETDIQVVSSQALFAPHTSCPFEWKARCFADVAEDFLDEHPDQPLQIISIGDGEFERMATNVCTQNASVEDQQRCRIKTIKFDDEPSVPRLQQQVEYCTAQMEKVFHLDRPARIELYLDLPHAPVTQHKLPEMRQPHAPEGGDGEKEHWGAQAGGGASLDYAEASFLTGGAQSGAGWRMAPTAQPSQAADIGAMMGGQQHISGTPPTCSTGSNSGSHPMWMMADGIL